MSAPQLTQMTTFKVCDYTQAKKQYALDLSTDTLKSPLFTNTSIERSIDLPFLKIILQELVKRGQGEWKKDHKNKEPTTLMLYWKTPQDWANQIYQYVSNTGQLNSVMTVFELLNGDDTVSECKLLYITKTSVESCMKLICTKKI